MSVSAVRESPPRHRMEEIMSNQQQAHKKIGFSDCMGLAIGQIIGSGIMVLTGIVIGMTGHGTPYAFILGALLAISVSVPFIILTSVIPSSGASYNYVKKMLGDKAGLVYIGMFALSQVMIATFAKGFAGYFCSIFQGFNESVVAMVALVLCTGVNLVGLQTSAKVQKCMVTLLLVSLFLFITFGLPKVEWSSLALASDNVMPNGVKSFLTGITLLNFACGGAKKIAENGDDIENPSKTIPTVIILSTSIVAVFYALIGIVAAGVLPVDQVAFQNLTLVAKTIFPTWLYLFFVFGGAMFALLTTLNGTLSWVTRGVQEATKDGWFPAAWAKENKNGVPYYILGFYFVMGALPIVTGMDMSLISSMGVGTDILTEFMVLVACWVLPKRLPEAYKQSRFYLPEGQLHGVLGVIGVLMLGTSYVNLSDLTVPAAIACAGFIVCLLVYMQFRYQYVAERKQ